ncbi:hypothetical protein [Oxynema aestuarii]|uniref:Uncharacterized protein n=1 Tax=Oxynema aestuarii AP17 TaxID=2064643 RepID=A0A6H1TUQ2_9CYAN|nr:hypothetical protein [Oxynema aestuarii]QIZ69680.1 hypothetical protein HCG48_03035 [Oxynema aestuarii AP17]
MGIGQIAAIATHKEPTPPDRRSHRHRRTRLTRYGSKCATNLYHPRETPQQRPSTPNVKVSTESTPLAKLRFAHAI